MTSFADILPAWRPWEVPHVHLPHQALALPKGLWRGPAPDTGSPTEPYSELGLTPVATLADDSWSWQAQETLIFEDELALEDPQDPQTRPHWIAARIAAARRATQAAFHPLTWMAILNLTADSFSDGGELGGLAQIQARAAARLSEGASWLDLGAESTRPGAVPVSAEQQLDCLLPALESLRDLASQLSVDTRSANVAQACLKQGATMINDVSALEDPAMAQIAADHGCELVLMHMRGTPANMTSHANYHHLLGEIADEWMASMSQALAAGVSPEKIHMDPGIGFAKDASHSLDLLGPLGSLRGLGFPLLVGPSRKSFLEEPLGSRPPREREAGTAGAVALCAAQGVATLRLHQGQPHWDAAQVARACAQTAQTEMPYGGNKT